MHACMHQTLSHSTSIKPYIMYNHNINIIIYIRIYIYVWLFIFMQAYIYRARVHMIYMCLY